MWSSSPQIAIGDLVIIWLTRDIVQSLVVSPGNYFNSKFGNYPHADFVGIPYGSKLLSRTGKGFIYILRPTPELWTIALPHRTQILYLADIAFITSHLNIKPRSNVVEAGTGSASFSHSIARTIGPLGHLWSYEFHKVRASKASDEFTRHGMNDVVTLTHRNVCKDGFTITDTADSVFLDLPAPWEAIEHAKRALRKDRITRICSFSPCMEQVLRTVNALNDAGFTEITMYETLLRPLDVSHTPRLQSVSDAGEKIKRAERKREEKRLKQIAAGRLSKRKREEDLAVHEDQQPQDHLDALAKNKRIKTDEEDAADHHRHLRGLGLGQVLEEQVIDVHQQSAISATAIPAAATNISLSKVLSEVRGHTSYLTFASLQPAVVVAAAAPETEVVE